MRTNESVMADGFAKNIAIIVLLILGFLGLDRLPPYLKDARGIGRLKVAIVQMHNSELNSDDFVTRANGYYEGIQHTVRIAAGAENDDYRLRDDFLRFEFKPNVNRAYMAGRRVTNSLGMPNPEYGYEKPPHTRRIALMGDSISVGPFEHDYVTLLENRLNRDHLTQETQRFEILNFAVPGYILAQKMEVALERAPRFHPDVYVVQLSSLEIGGIANHISRLVVSGLDMKYDYLKRIAAEADVQPKDPRSTVRYKLAPYFAPMTRWALEQIRDHAAAEGAQMIILLLNPISDPGMTAKHFTDLHEIADKVGAPVIDLGGTFVSGKMPELEVIPEVDPHPNAQGHKLIFENLYAKLRAQPTAWAALTGSAAEKTAGRAVQATK